MLNMNPFVIDVETPFAKEMVRRLNRRASIHRVELDGQYAIDPEYSRIYVETPLDESNLDHWLCSMMGYIGVISVDRRPE